MKLLAYCRANDWAGYDPYDALNSRLFSVLPALDSRFPRLVFTQVLKRSPLNFRRLVGIPRTQNPKALALFLSSVLKLSKLRLLDRDDLSALLIERLVAARSPGTDYWCWGYSFPWQTRTIVVPRGAPNLVCTVFVAEALLDAYAQLGDARCLAMAVSAGEYIRQDLYYMEGDGVASFSYPLPGLKTKVHNANFLAAALLCRLFCLTKDDRWVDLALRVARYSASKQKSDGSWDYGESATQRWVDNFHTGYNLGALRALDGHLGSTEFEPCVQRGFKFYSEHFIRCDGAARYFHNKTYPIDVHCVAQSIITLLTFRDLDPESGTKARQVYAWAVRHMWNDDGFFSYRVLRFFAIRTPYMRWSEAWMLLALATLAEAEAAPRARPVAEGVPAPIDS